MSSSNIFFLNIELCAILVPIQKHCPWNLQNRRLIIVLYKQLPSPVVLTATSPEITSFGIKTCDNSSVGRCDFTSFSAGIFNDWEKSCFTVQCRHLKLPFQAVQNWQIQTFFCQCVCTCIRTSLSNWTWTSFILPLHNHDCKTYKPINTNIIRLYSQKKKNRKVQITVKSH